jgi:ribosomal protein S18 acetylase RimI-like enzyme
MNAPSKSQPIEAVDIRIRRATRADLPLIVRYNCLMATETERIALDVDDVTAGVRAVLDDTGRGFYLVAEALVTSPGEGEVISMDDDGEPVTISSPPPPTWIPVGQLLVTYEWSDWRCGDFWWIQSVYVDPHHRRQGVFRTLFDHVRRESEERVDVVGLRLYTEKGNARAQATYESLGMQGERYVIYEMEKKRTKRR